MTKQLGAIGKTAHQVLTDYIEVVELVAPVNILRVVPTDPDDDHVIAAAVVAKADLIVSGDHDLLNLQRYQEIPIVTAADAMKILSAG